METFKTYPPEISAARDRLLSIAKDLQADITRKYAAPDPEKATALEMVSYDAHKALRDMQEEFGMAMEPFYRQLSYLEGFAAIHVKLEDGEISASLVDLLEK